ncbi:fibronectin type III domain-containing protein [Bdellovibrio sp. HCB185ZH]|uniref:fibronectin type III domain-containing protein n=1 Tax=Bdellovibrio sp. HCB185ZH TaxID=3394235 RepID=UPI0039A64CE3
MITLTGCLKAREVASLTASSSAWFVGATTAKNLGGYPSAVKVSWTKADRATLGYNVYSLRTNSSGSNQWTLVGSVDADSTSFTDSDSLTEGQIYTYKVLAIDALTGEEDGNTKQVSTVTFYGIAGVTITGKTTASISLNGSTGAFDSIKIYAQPKNGGSAATLVATANGNVENIDVTGLRSGVNYKFYARAYMSYLGAEDGNDSTILGQTYSDSFGSGKDNDTTFYYRGILNFQGYGTAPNATSGPKARQFNITWLPFSNANSTTKYRVMRSTTTSIDTTVTTACTATSTTSCKVCEVTGTQYCEDTALASPPQIYYYAITLVKKDSAGVEYTEELPCQNSNDCSNKALYTVKAHVPSDYMVLVQRDAANYEMCLNINAASDPRHNQRCVYTGLGAVPSTTGPTKPVRTYDNGYYDFGYNMLVDRYKVACNWTQNVNSCVTGQSSSGGGCIGVFTTGTGGLTGLYPTKNGGGRVMLGFSNNTSNGDCFIDTVNLGGSTTNWYSVGQDATSLSLADIAKATTIDPGATGNKFRPPIHRMTPAGAARICNAQSSDYGSKRLLRRREYIVASPMPYIPGEPNAVTTAMSVFDAPNNTTCNPTAALASGATGDAAITAYLNSSNYQTAMTVNGTVLNSYSYGERFFIGNTATSQCVSRFGIQDPYTFYSPGIIFSDYFANSNFGTSPANATGMSGSDLDVSASDFANYSFNGTMAPNRGFYFGYGRYIWMQPTPTQTSYYGCNASVNMTKFIAPLGAPVCTWTGGSQTFRTLSELTASGRLGTAHIGLSGSRATARFPFNDQNMTGFVMTSSGEDTGRWSFSMADSAGYNVSGLLCGVEAE